MRLPLCSTLFLLCIGVLVTTVRGQSQSAALEKLRAHPDLLVVNGTIVTVDAAMNRYQAMAVRQGGSSRWVAMQKSVRCGDRRQRFWT